MSDSSRTQAFADALQSFESEKDDAALLACFADGARLIRPEADRSDTEDDPQAFWQAYLDQFGTIATSFDEVREEGDLGVLEWHSEGELATGRDIAYRGVSVLVFDGEEVTRFSTYYDTAAFVEPQA